MGEVHLTKGSSLIAPSGGQTEGMIRMNAITDLSDQLCGTRHGAIVSGGGTVRHDLGPGDFALIPAFAEHQEVNDSEEDITWVIARGGRNPIVENLEGWSRKEGMDDTAGG
ncbi:hypothetical protein EG328_007547 [Venturia inaequalis]|uniref:Cupin 2 conserved barrel domain-containing protein n=1 Tax=Venturia inaequalis TaxID=5025 RepID=A0A8H3YQN5_VENIN|nr:hypothetical protein EG328_007547 [Venturia inaequalis]